MDIRDLDRRTLATLDKLVSGVSPADLDRRTPCEGWNLGELLRHQVSENHAFATAFREGSAPDWNSGTLGTDPYRSYADSVDDYLAALEDKELFTRQVTINTFGSFPGEVAAAMHLVDS